MIVYRNGDIFSSRADAIINPVNCVGVMGAGLARQFKERFPENFSLYSTACSKGCVKVGAILVVKVPLSGCCKYVINFPTKLDWRNPSKLSWIVSGLRELRQILLSEEQVIKSVAIPRLGCGLGGLHWEDVRKEIENELKELPHTIYVYGDSE